MRKALQALEFNKVIEQLKPYATSSLGVEKIESLGPSTHFEEVSQMQAETDEGAKVVRLKESVPLGGIHDLRPSLKRAVIGSSLDPEELLNVADTMNSGRRFKSFVNHMI